MCCETSLHKMIHPQNPCAHSIHTILYFSVCVMFVQFRIIFFFFWYFLPSFNRPPGRFVTILRASAHAIRICVILLLRTINYIFMLYAKNLLQTWMDTIFVLLLPLLFSTAVNEETARVWHYYSCCEIG